jgi:hypothetical protein
MSEDDNMDTNTDAMIVCSRYTCKHHCAEKQDHCVSGLIYIDASGKCQTYESDHDKTERLMAEVRKELEE